MYEVIGDARMNELSVCVCVCVSHIGNNKVREENYERDMADCDCQKCVYIGNN